MSGDGGLGISLDIEMAYLDLDGNEKNNLNQNQLHDELKTSSVPTSDDSCAFRRRSKRKIIRSLNSENRRSFTKPRKLSDTSYKETVNYYLNKRVKRLPSTLETIFEEPQTETVMSGRKLKRYISFQEVGTITKDKNKIKKRHLKAKKVTPMKRLKKATMELLIQKLQSIEKAD